MPLFSGFLMQMCPVFQKTQKQFTNAWRRKSTDLMKKTVPRYFQLKLLKNNSPQGGGRTKMKWTYGCTIYG